MEATAAWYLRNKVPLDESIKFRDEALVEKMLGDDEVMEALFAKAE